MRILAFTSRNDVVRGGGECFPERNDMLKFLFPCLLSLSIVGAIRTQAQERSTTLIQSILDESISIATDKPVYFPDDTVYLTIQRKDNPASASITPIIDIDSMKLTPVGHDAYIAVIPQTVIPGSYRILLRMVEAGGHRIVYETNRVLEIEEYQAIERLSDFVSIVPLEGSREEQSAVTLDGEQVRSLHVVFRRNSIRLRMGPQFVTIRTTVLLREGITVQTFERRVVTFPSHGNANEDRALFQDIIKAYENFKE